MKLILDNEIINAAQYYLRNDIEEIELSEKVKEIEDWAFGYCSNLKNVKISSSVIKISPSAFDGCFGLERFDVSENNKFFSCRDGVLYDKEKQSLIRCPLKKISHNFVIQDTVKSINENAFNRCKYVKAIQMHKNVEGIHRKAFAYSGIEGIFEIPQNLMYIGEAAFADCYNLSKFKTKGNEIFFSQEGCLFRYENRKKTLIQYPLGSKEQCYEVDKDTENIKDRAFTCSHLQKICVNSNNNNYFSRDGVLFDRIRKRLCYYPNYKQAKFYEIPRGTKYIGNSAVKRNAFIETIVFPNELINIERHSFEECYMLSNVKFNGEKLKKIEWSAFYDCMSLNKVDLSRQSQLELIDGLAFSNCIQLIEIRLPNINFCRGRGIFRGSGLEGKI